MLPSIGFADGIASRDVSGLSVVVALLKEDRASRIEVFKRG
jgi:hypothetical protein